jgi:serine/threonine protein phosphatase PrpC
MQLIPHRLDCYGISDIGYVRSNNEDAWEAAPEHRFFVLADGMGGHNAGEVAAKMAVVSLCESLKELKELTSNTELKSSMRSAILAANSSIYTSAGEKEDLSGMGTTLCCLAFHHATLIYAHIGDSRIYRFRNKCLEQLTQDHSLRRELLMRGELSAKQAACYPHRNIITRALGTSAHVEPEIAHTDVALNDVYFLCSDGLTDHLSNEEIASLLQNSSSLSQASHELVEKAKAKGGCDNITIVMVKVVA